MATPRPGSSQPRTGSMHWILSAAVTITDFSALADTSPTAEISGYWRRNTATPFRLVGPPVYRRFKQGQALPQCAALSQGHHPRPCPRRPLRLKVNGNLPAGSRLQSLKHFPDRKVLMSYADLAGTGGRWAGWSPGNWRRVADDTQTDSHGVLLQRWNHRFTISERLDDVESIADRSLLIVSQAGQVRLGSAPAQEQQIPLNHVTGSIVELEALAHLFLLPRS